LQAHVETKDSIAGPVVPYAQMHFEVVDAVGAVDAVDAVGNKVSLKHNIVWTNLCYLFIAYFHQKPFAISRLS